MQPAENMDEIKEVYVSNRFVLENTFSSMQNFKRKNR
jgi:hypothetical protein